MKRRAAAASVGIGWCMAAAMHRAAAQPTAGASAWAKVGIVSLLGNSIRIYARENREALFNDLGMDALFFEIAEKALQSMQPQAQIERLQASGNMDVADQIAIGTAAGRRGTLPDWVQARARSSGWSHLLMASSDIGPMEFKTGLSQVVGDSSVAGVGFWVGADYRWKNERTGAISNGYLAPFIQLRVTLIDLKAARVVRSVLLSEGFAAGPPENEAPYPWNFLTRREKADALIGLLRKNLQRGAQTALAGD